MGLGLADPSFKFRATLDEARKNWFFFDDGSWLVGWRRIRSRQSGKLATWFAVAALGVKSFLQFYRTAKTTKLPGHLKNQFLRASSSIALNLSEGSGRAGHKDRQHFYQIAFGSVRECQSILQLEPDYFTDEERDLLDHLAASTYKLAKCRSR